MECLLALSRSIAPIQELELVRGPSFYQLGINKSLKECFFTAIMSGTTVAALPGLADGIVLAWFVV